jgi:C4-dicarboxylate transporter DctM subunit
MTAVMLTTMVLCFALTVSVAVSIGLASVLGIQVADANMLISVKEMFNAINKFPLAAIPFFILAGNIMETGGISRRLVEFAKSLVGGVQGGLPMTCVLTCMIFASVSGSSVATTFAIGTILIPALIKTRLSHYLGCLAAGHQRRARRDHPAVDPDDSLWRKR